MPIFANCTRETLEIIQDAVDAAYLHGHAEVLPVHIAFCLLYEPKGQLYSVLSEVFPSFRTECSYIRRGIDEYYKTLPVVLDVDRHGQITFAQNTKDVLEKAYQIATYFKDTHITPLYLLVGTITNEPVAAIFEYWGITKDMLIRGRQDALYKQKQQTDLPILYGIQGLDEKQRLGNTNGKYVR